ncbi:MAG: sensor histidine kinase [Longimicrobiales bacterium]
MRFRLSWTIFGLTVSLVGAVLIVLFAIIVRATSSSINAVEEDQLARDVAAVEAAWDSWVDTRISEVMIRASDPTLQASASTRDAATIRQSLESQMRASSAASRFEGVRIDGRMVASIGDPLPEKSWATREQFFRESSEAPTGDLFRLGEDVVFVAGAPVASVGVQLGSIVVAHSISEDWIPGLAPRVGSSIGLAHLVDAGPITDGSLTLPNRDGSPIAQVLVSRSGEFLETTKHQLLLSGLQISLLVLVGAGLLGVFVGRLAQRELGVVEVAVEQLASGELTPGTAVSRLRDFDSVLGQVRNVHQLLIETQSDLKKSERMAVLGNMAGSVAHDVRTPLTSIGMSIELLRRGLRPEEQNRLLSRIESESERIERLMGDLTEFAKGNRAPQFSSVNLQSWIGDIEGYWSELLDARRVEFRTSIQDVTNWTMDSSRLRRATDNLIKNAAEALSGRIPAIVDVSVDRTSHGNLRIQVADNGAGIPEELLPELFNPFFSKKKRGTGLGLAIVKSAAEDHDGSVTVASSENGTNFAIIIPEQLHQATHKTTSTV